MKPAKVINSDEINLILSRLSGLNYRDAKSFVRIRNLAMVLLMLDAGLRVREVSRLSIGDLFWDETPIEVLVVRSEVSKSKRDREIPLSSRIQTALKDHYVNLRYLGNTLIDNYCFTPHACVRGLTVRQIHRMVAGVSFRAIHRRISPHVLRHTFATRLLRKTNIRVVQELLGHRNLQSTQIYTHPTTDDLKEAINNSD